MIDIFFRIRLSMKEWFLHWLVNSIITLLVLLLHWYYDGDHRRSKKKSAEDSSQHATRILALLHGGGGVPKKKVTSTVVLPRKHAPPTNTTHSLCLYIYIRSRIVSSKPWGLCAAPQHHEHIEATVVSILVYILHHCGRNLDSLYTKRRSQQSAFTYSTFFYFFFTKALRLRPYSLCVCALLAVAAAVCLLSYHRITKVGIILGETKRDQNHRGGDPLMGYLFQSECLYHF